MIRSLLFYISLAFSFISSAQITFYGEAEPVLQLNSSSGENYLYLDRTGTELYFVREKHPDNSGGTADRGDLWKALQDSAWQQPVHFGINDDQFTVPLGTTTDEKYFIYGRTWFERGMHYSGVFALNRTNESEELPVEVPFFRNRSPLLTGNISADGQHLVLSLENSAGYGVDDLFICVLQPDGSWSSPKNLGHTINTRFQELTPFLAADNKTLFFASNGRSGAGSFDLYKATRMDDTWQNWTDPENLGGSVNTVGSETSFVFNTGDDFAYFVSTQNSDGYGDIKKIRITSDIREDSLISTAEMIVNDKETTRAITFQLVNKKTGRSITGRGIVLKDSDTVEIEATAGGQLVLEAAEENVTVEFKSQGYLSVKETIDQSRFNAAQEMWVIGLEPLSTGNVITLSNVLFYRGTANFVEGSDSELDLVVEMMKENPEIKIFLKGHTDNVGNSVLNVHLSNERVKSVINYLTGKGISADRISGKGFGGSEPVADNTQEETRMLNRRVEFVVVRD